MLTLDDLKPGTQIAYIPTHVLEDRKIENPLSDPSVEFGFVVNHSQGSDEHVFCRYWRTRKPEPRPALRTTCNSERTWIYNLQLHTFCDQRHVDKLLKEIENEHQRN